MGKLKAGKHVLPTTAVIAVALVLPLLAGPVQAAPYASYTYNSWGEPVPAPQAYIPEKTVNLADLGLGKFRDPQDIFVADDNHVYILDTGNNRLVCLNANWSLHREISSFQHDGRIDNFNNPNGAFRGGKWKYIHC